MLHEITHISERTSNLFKIKMDGGTTPNYYQNKDCGTMYLSRDSFVLGKNVKMDDKENNLHDISAQLVSGNKNIQKDSMMPIPIKDGCSNDLTELDNESLNVVTSEDPIRKLDALIQNFKHLFLGENTQESKMNETHELCCKTSNTSGLENMEAVLTENDTEGYVLEHKSIDSLEYSGSLRLNLSTFRSTLKTSEDNTNGRNETEVLSTPEVSDKMVRRSVESTVSGEPTPSECTSDEREQERVNHFEVTCEISQINNSDFFKDIGKTLKLDSSTSETSSIRDVDGDNRPYKFERSYIFQENNCEDDRKSSGFLNYGNIDRTKISLHQKFGTENRSGIFSQISGNSSLTEGRVLIQEGDLEVDIYEAVRRDDESLVRLFLARGADPNEPDWEGKGDPPIVQAALRQNTCIVKLLCESGCDVNLTSVRGETALHMAVSRRPVSLHLLDTLLSAGCDANIQDKLRGCSALHCVSGFADDEPQVFQKLVTVTDVNLRDHRHSTVLHRIAATSSNVLRIMQLLELGADPSIQNDRGETALCVALERGWGEGALALVTGGTDLSRTNIYRETALHVAARHDQADVVAALLCHGAEVNTQDLGGNTALHLAAGRGYVNTVRQLLMCPHLDLDTHNSDHATPLTCAVESGFISVVQMLVKAEQVDLQPALDLAKQGYRRLSQPEMCQLLTDELERRQMPHLT